MRNVKDTETKSTRPSAEEREITRMFARKYARGMSQPRLIDIANATPRGKAGVMAVLRAFTKAKA